MIVFVAGIVTAHEVNRPRVSGSQRATIAAQEGLEVARALPRRISQSRGRNCGVCDVNRKMDTFRDRRATRELIARELVISRSIRDASKSIAGDVAEYSPSNQLLSLYWPLARWRDLSNYSSATFLDDGCRARALSGDNKVTESDNPPIPSRA